MLTSDVTIWRIGKGRKKERGEKRKGREDMKKEFLRGKGGRMKGAWFDG